MNLITLGFIELQYKKNCPSCGIELLKPKKFFRFNKKNNSIMNVIQEDK